MRTWQYQRRNLGTGNPLRFSGNAPAKRKDLGRVGTSDNNCKAKFYTITKQGRKELCQDSAYWHRPSGVVARVLAVQDKGGQR
jgi:hypothetical protein